MEDELPKAGGGDHIFEVPKAVDIAEKVKAVPGHEASAYNRGNTSEGGVPPSTPAEEKQKGRNEDHSRLWRHKSSKESSVKEVPPRESSQTERRRLASTRTRK